MTKARRDWGDGALYERSDGRWTACLRVNGKRRYFYGKDRKEAKAKLEKAKRALEKGVLVTGPKQTLEQFLTYWLSVKKPTVKETTAFTHEWFVQQVFDELGHVKLEKLTPDLIQGCYNHLQERLSSNTVRGLHVTLSSALDDAVTWKRLGYNPCRDVKPPRAEKHDIAFLTPDQVKELMKAAEGSSIECMITVAVTLGLRRGELLALRWSDLSLEERRLSVRRTVAYLKVDGTRQHIETEPKTTSSKRHITLPQIVVDALRAHRTRQLAAKVKSRDKWQETDLVFCSHFGTYIHPPTLYRLFAQVVERAELPPMRFHDLRHTAATVMLIRGIHPKVVQEMLGHSSIQITLNLYSHVIPTLQKSAMDELDLLYTVAK